VLIAIDIGNTNSSFGLFRDDLDTPITTWRASSVRERTSDEWAVFLHSWLAETRTDPAHIDGFAVSSVSPMIDAAIAPLGQRLFHQPTLMVSLALDLGIQVTVEIPAEMGSDRLVNAAEAFRRFGGPLIVVDMGTATKIEAINAQGDFLGGVIAPGLALSLESLASKAARLFTVPLALAPHAIATNTIHAVQAGVVNGHLAMIEGMVARVRVELGGADRVVLTGGHSHAIATSSAIFTDFLPDLTLEGIAQIYRRNRLAG